MNTNVSLKRRQFLSFFHKRKIPFSPQISEKIFEEFPEEEENEKERIVNKINKLQ